MRFYLHVLALIVFSISFCSCSRVDLALRWADTFLYYELKSVFDFGGKQKPIVESVSDSLVAEIKKDWLPIVSARFNTLSEKVDVKSKEEIKNILDSEVEFVQERLKKMYLIAAGQISALAKTVSEENWTYFKEEFEEKNEGILSEEPENKIQDILENFLGRLSKEQKELIKNWIKQNPSDLKLRVENRRHIITQINSKVAPWSADKWSEAILVWLKDPQAMNLPAYETYLKKRTESVVALLVDVLYIMSDEQRKDLKENLLDWHRKLSH
jgi:hypothetical protein